MPGADTPMPSGPYADARLWPGTPSMPAGTMRGWETPSRLMYCVPSSGRVQTHSDGSGESVGGVYVPGLVSVGGDAPASRDSDAADTGGRSTPMSILVSVSPAAQGSSWNAMLPSALVHL